MGEPDGECATTATWGDTHGEVARRKAGYNFHFRNLPDDANHFYMAEMEGKLNTILHCNGEWIYATREDGERDEHAQLDEDQRRLSDWWKLHGNLRAPQLVPFVLNWIDQSATTPCAEEFRRALTYLCEHGSTRNRQLARRALAGDVQQTPIVGNSPNDIHCGSKVQLVDCTVGNIAIRRLHFHAVDFGGEIKIHTKIQKKVDCRKRLRT